MKKKSKTSHQRSQAKLKNILAEALRKKFPNDTVDVSDGFKDNIHVMVVSRKFDNLDEQKKQDILWGIIDRTDLNDDEKTLISLIYPVSPSEIK